MPGPTMMAGPPQWVLKKRCSPNTVGGTTDEMIPASTERHGIPSMSSSVLMRTAYSSDVRSATVWIRQCATRSASRNTPITVFVFPTSTASSVVMRCDCSSPEPGVVGWLPPMGFLSKIFASLVVVSVAACGGPSDAPPGPLAKHFDDMYIAAIPLDQKQQVVQTQNDWSLAKMENAKAEADLNSVNTQIDIGRNDVKAAKLA